MTIVLPDYDFNKRNSMGSLSHEYEQLEKNDSDSTIDQLSHFNNLTITNLHDLNLIHDDTLILNTPPASQDFKYSNIDDSVSAEKTPNIDELDSYFQIPTFSQNLSIKDLRVENDILKNNSISMPASPHSPPSLTYIKNFNYRLSESSIDYLNDSLPNLSESRRSSSLSSTYSSVTKYDCNLSHLKFLLIDDNPINLKILSKVLIKLYPNSTIHPTSNPKEVLSLVESNKYDVLFLDIEMPEMSGIDIAKIIRTKQAEVKKYEKLSLIAVTSRSSMENMKEYEELGIDLTLPKPLTRDYNSLISKIDKVINYRLNL